MLLVCVGRPLYRRYTKGRCDQTARQGHRGRNASLRSYIGRRNRFGRYCVDSTRYRTVPVRATQVALSFQSRDAASDRRELLHPHRYPPRRFISRQLLACHRLNSPTVGSSVSAGTNNLDAAIRSTDGPIFVAGLSQGTLVLDREQARLANDPTAPPWATHIHQGRRPNNLLWRAFRPGTHVPIIDYTVPAPVESQYDTINIVGQYDIFLTRLIVRATYSLTSMRLPRADTTATAPPHSRTQLALRLGTLRRQRTVWVRRPRPTSSGPISYLWCGRWWTWRACPAGGGNS